MKKFNFLFGFLLLSSIFIRCSGLETGQDNILSPGRDDYSQFGLSKNSKVDRLLAFTAISSNEINFEVIEETSELKVTKISGIKDFIYGNNKKYKVTGSIDFIIVQQEVINGQEQNPVTINEISGLTFTEEVFGNSPEQWYGGIHALSGGCTSDEECEETMAPWPPFLIECISGDCKYTDPN